VAAGGAVGARWAGRFRIFRYEVRRWLDGVIPDVGEAVDVISSSDSNRGPLAVRQQTLQLARCQCGIHQCRGSADPRGTEEYNLGLGSRAFTALLSHHSAIGY